MKKTYLLNKNMNNYIEKFIPVIKAKNIMNVDQCAICKTDIKKGDIFLMVKSKSSSTRKKLCSECLKVYETDI